MAARKLAKKLVDWQKTAASQQKIIRCLIPATYPSSFAITELLLWLLSNIFTLPISTMKTAFAYIIGLLENDIIDAMSVAWTYEKLFCAINREGLEPVVYSLLLMITTPELITRFRVIRLLHIREKNKRPYVNSLLGLYKTLRPDKVPERVQMLSNIPSVSIEAAMRNGLLKTRDRITASQQKCSATDVRKQEVSWCRGQQTGRNSKKLNCLLPPVSFHLQNFNMGNIFEQPRLLVENRTMEEVGLYILTSQSPAQSLTLLSSPGGIFFLQFCRPEVRQRFNFTLHHTLRFAIVEMQEKNADDESKLDLLNSLYDMQETYLGGSVVVTTFVSQFLKYQSWNPKFLPVILKLMTRPVFDVYSELYSSLLHYIKNIFLIADSETRVEILAVVGNLILNLLWKAQKIKSHRGILEMTTTLKNCYEFYSRLFNVALASNKPNNCLALISTSLHFYNMVMVLELQVTKFEIWTLPPATLLLACLTSSCSWLVDSACQLLLTHRDQGYEARRGRSKLYVKEISIMNDIASNFVQHLCFNKMNKELTRVSSSRDLFHRINENVMYPNENYLGVDIHVALAPQRSLFKHRFSHSMKYDDILLFCEKNLPALYNFIQQFIIQNDLED